MRWLDGITDWMDVSLSELRKLVTRGVRPRLEGKTRTPLSSRVATRVSWSPLCLHLPKPQEQAQSAVSAHLDSTSGCEPPPLPSRAPGVREPPPPLSPSRPGINCHMCIPYQAHPDQHMLSKEAIGISTKNNPGTKYIKLGQATR